MTESEKKIKDALAVVPLILIVPGTERQKRFTDMGSFTTYAERELEFWQPVINGRPSPGIATFQRLIDCQNQLRTAQQNLEPNPAQCVADLRRSASFLQSFELFSETIQGQFIRAQWDTGVERFHGSLFFLQPSVYPSATGSYSVEILKGFLDAEARFRGSPKKWANEIVRAVEEQKNHADEILGDLQARFAVLTGELDHRAASVEAQFGTQSSELVTFRDEWKGQIEELHSNAAARMVELEALYREKLRLKGPAQYWKDLTNRYRTSGILWSAISGLLVVAGSVAGIWGLEFFQKALQAGQTVTQGSTTTDWSHILPVTIVFGVIISVWVFVIRTTIRLALSGFHLVRDAVEREQLSHYYLALIAENKEIDKEAQAIILQSLFSRAETGLLKGESGPTMPGNLAEILKNVRG